MAIEATDDFGLHDVSLHYSVNGGPEKAVSLLQSKGVKSSNGSTVIALEDYQMSPGDVVAIYATAKDARFTAKTDIFFVAKNSAGWHTKQRINPTTANDQFMPGVDFDTTGRFMVTFTTP